MQRADNSSSVTNRFTKRSCALFFYQSDNLFLSLSSHFHSSSSLPPTPPR